MKFVIIGGDAAGMSAASRAKRHQPDLQVIVYERTGDVSYSACGMPYNIAAPERDMDDLVVRSAEVFREKQDIDVRLGHDVETIDTRRKMVKGRDASGQRFESTYDNLLIATGAHPILPEIPGIDLPGIMALKTLEQGRMIKSFLKQRRNPKVVILGMGYIALEMCEAVRVLGLDVDMVKPRNVFLPQMDRSLAQVIQDEVTKNGAGVHMGHAIEKIEKAGDKLAVVCTDTTFIADLVLVAIGVIPNSRIAVDAGIDIGTGKAITVDENMRTSETDIYAAGDCADAYHVVTGQKTWIPLALRANRSGWAVADNVCGKDTRLQGIVGTSVFKVFDLQVASTGLNTEEATQAGFDPEQVTIKSRSRAHAHPNASTIWVHMVGDRKTGRLLGVQMVGKEGVAHRINAPAVALHNRMTVEAFSQSDLAYAPPFSPVWDPMLTAANQLVKKL